MYYNNLCYYSDFVLKVYLDQNEEPIFSEQDSARNSKQNKESPSVILLIYDSQTLNKTGMFSVYHESCKYPIFLNLRQSLLLCKTAAVRNSQCVLQNL